MKIVLASTSARRRELMNLITKNFIAVDPKVIEEEVEVINEYPLDIAMAKNIAMKNQFNNDLIIAADTVVFIDSIILEKPQSREDAKRMIRLLSGKKHLVKSAVSISYQNYQENFIEKTFVYFSKLSDLEIEKYLDSKEYIGKSGGYGIQGEASKFIYKIEGDYYNVMGLPVASIYNKIKNFINK